MDERLKRVLAEQVAILRAAAAILEESRARVSVLRLDPGAPLSASERESCEALTARFARLNDLLMQRLFRTIDQIELCDEGSALDRLNRMERRGVVRSAEGWRELRQLRNAIAHDYLLREADRLLESALAAAPELVETAAALERYARMRGYLDPLA